MKENNLKYITWKAFFYVLLALLPLFFSIGYFALAQVQSQNNLKISAFKENVKNQFDYIKEQLQEIKKNLKEIKDFLKK